MVVLIVGWILVVRIVTGGRGGRVVFAVMPDTTNGAPPVDAAIACTGATVPVCAPMCVLVVLAAIVDLPSPSSARYHATGNEERTMGSISLTCKTTL
jgi:hypothetical protein